MKKAKGTTSFIIVAIVLLGMICNISPDLTNKLISAVKQIFETIGILILNLFNGIINFILRIT